MAGLVSAVFNCQGPLEAPIFVGSGLISKKTAHYSITEFPLSVASEAVIKNKEAGAVAACDRIPFSHVSANFTFNTDNCVSVNILMYHKNLNSYSEVILCQCYFNHIS